MKIFIIYNIFGVKDFLMFPMRVILFTKYVVQLCSIVFGRLPTFYRIEKGNILLLIFCLHSGEYAEV